MRTILLATALATFSSAAFGSGFSFQPLGFGAGDSFADSVSGDGTTVVGRRSTLTESTGFRWNAQGGVESIPVLFPTAVSLDGSIVAGNEGPAPVGWTEEMGKVYLVGATAKTSGSAAVISGDGTVWGTNYDSDTETSTAYQWTQTGGATFLTTPAGYQNLWLSGVSENGQTVIGVAWTGAGPRVPIRLSEDEPFTDFGSLSGDRAPTGLADITPDGQLIVGRTVDEAFLWRESTGIVGLGDLPGGSYYSEARAVSADGRVVVGFSDSFDPEAFLWNGAAGMLSLPELRARQGQTVFADWKWSLAADISDDGRTIVGYGFNPQNYREGWVVRLPLTGDATFDDIVDGADYVAWADHFLETDTNWSQGDFNFDGKTDAVDYVIWADHFAPSRSVSISIVPEPSPQLLMLFGAVLISTIRLRLKH